VEKFMVPVHDTHAAEEEQGKVLCFVCEADLTERKVKEKEGKEKIRPGLVEINCEGTGFASAGGNKVTKEGVNFKC
jgi:nitric oxide synthase-interacting protein